MMRHNEEGLVRQMCDAGAVGAAFIVSPAFVPCRLERASKARLAWRVENPGSKANKRRTSCTTRRSPLALRSRLALARVCPPTGAGAAITADTGATYTSSGAGAGVKYPSTGAGAQTTADAGAMYSSIGAGAQNTAVASAMCSSTGVGVAITADADTMCSYTGAGAGITADTGATYTSSGAGAGVMYPSNGAGAQYTASAGATGVLLPVKVPSVYDLAHTTAP